MYGISNNSYRCDIFTRRIALRANIYYYVGLSDENALPRNITGVSAEDCEAISSSSFSEYGPVATLCRRLGRISNVSFKIGRVGISKRKFE